MKIVVSLWNFLGHNSLTVKAVPTLTNWRNSMKAIVKAALAIPEMEYAFEIICADSRKEPEEFSDQEIVDEAEYRLSCFFESGHDNNEARIGEFGKEEKAAALKNVRMLKSFVKKYKTADGRYSHYIKHLNLI